MVVAGVQDPDVARWSSAEAVDATTTYRRVAAVSALDGRRRTVARLRGLGATVIDAAPGTLATELADTYLRVKATGQPEAHERAAENHITIGAAPQALRGRRRARPSRGRARRAGR